MSNDVIERLKNYCLNHPDLMEMGIIKGINSSDGKVVLEKDGINKNISIEDLENNKFDFDAFKFIEDKNVLKTPELSNLDIMVSSNKMIDEEIESLDESQTIVTVADKIPSTLDEIQKCAKNKQEELIDKALATFAIDEKTGNININKAIKVVTDNCINNVVNSIKDNKVLSTNLSDYNIDSCPIREFSKSDSKLDIQKLINDSFNNIMVYVEVAKLKNIIYNESQIVNAKNKYATSVNDKLNVLGLNKNDDSESISAPVTVAEENTSVTSDIKPDNNIKKAGFADILILTVIILIYAAIIINLIMKLK